MIQFGFGIHGKDSIRKYVDLTYDEDGESVPSADKTMVT